MRGPLALSFDDFIRTSSDPRHRVGVERLWRQCAASGGLYRKEYEGLYCVGCEQFYTPDELVEGRCSEHGTEPQLVAEENWFFRLSRYADRLHQLISSGDLRIEPAARRNEVLALIKRGLHDFSVSRSHSRARGWGIPVPDDPSQSRRSALTWGSLKWNRRSTAIVARDRMSAYSDSSASSRRPVDTIVTSGAGGWAMTRSRS
ncbi:class I tRNA ligase family protein [Streptomyces sp. NPDC001795]|uniref:class I tRNA ligase family protein n=1 Tax=unclassified Streptomyces TaxID=2593676 RepID=UPI0033284EA4